MTEKDKLYKKALGIEYFSIMYNVAEAVISIAFGYVAGSIALIGFGLDSVVESLSSSVLIWHLNQRGKFSEEEEERIERRVMKLVAATFFILGAYVLFESVRKLLVKDIPDTSLPGIIIAAISLIVMPVVTWMKYRVGNQINCRALIADSKETLACSFLSLALLVGLGCNYFFNFWQADPLAGFVIVIFLFREGWEGWHDGYEADERE